MPADTEPTPPQAKNIKAADFRSIYSNNAAFQVGLFDYSIFFGEVVGVGLERESITVEQKVKVIMSPLHAKIFVFTALQQLQALEKQWGTIEIPEGIVGGNIPFVEPQSEPEDKQ